MKPEMISGTLFREEKDLMLQAFIITLREGVEAALIVGIVFAYLSKIGREELKKTVYWALGAAIAASVAGAVIMARLQVNTDIFEGWVMLGAAFFVPFDYLLTRFMYNRVSSRINS